MKAIILAAGRGERMRPLTDSLPKPLLPAGGKTLIARHLEKFAAAGITEVVINHAHLGALIEDALGDGARWGVHIAYSREVPALETAGGIARALPLLGDGPFAAVNADVYSEYDYAGLAAAGAAMAPGDLAHLVLVDNPPHHPRGDFALAADRLTGGSPRLTFSGLGIYRAALFRDIAPGTAAPLAPLLYAAADAGQAGGEHYRGRWRDIGTPQRLADLDRELAI